MDYDQRQDRLRRRIRREGFDGVLITRLANVRYLTGFTGSDGSLFLTPTDAILMSDGRYEEQIAEECSAVAVEIRRPPTSWAQLVSKVIRQSGVQKVAFERDALTVGQLERLVELLPRQTLRGVSGWVEELRQIKDREELACIRRAIDLAESAFRKVVTTVSLETTECLVAAELEYAIRCSGGEGCSFPPIVAVGPHAARPHARPRPVRLDEGGFVLIDWGARVNGYTSDLTRVVPVTRISPKLERLYEIVCRAQRAAIQMVRPGVACSQVDRAARTVIQDAGYGKRFPHGLGHGIGLEIHEGPRLAPGEDQIIKAGMVVTIEPGIYFPGWGGLRIEDDVYVTRQGAHLLTQLTSQLEDLLIK